MRLESVMDDVRHALRALARSPGFTLVAVLTLAIGIGGNSAMFTFVNAIAFQPLVGIRDAQDLVWLSTRFEERRQLAGMSYPDVRDVRSGTSAVFSGVAAFDRLPFNMGSGEEPRRIQGHIVTANYFDVLGVRAEAGRLFGGEEDGPPGAHPVAVISDRLWQSQFGGSPSIVGAAVVLNGHTFTVIGVASPGFAGPQLGEGADVWVPISMARAADPQGGARLEDRAENRFTTMARLRPGVGREAAQAAVATVRRAITEADTPLIPRGEAVVSPAGSGLGPESVPEAVPMLVLLMAVTGLVLMIACANVANLLLARTAARTREIAVRVAIGANRGRIIRQFLTESLVLASLGGVAGLMLAAWSAELLRALIDAGDLDALRVRADASVLFFTLGATAGTALLFGLAPALQGSRTDLLPAMRDGAGGTRRSRSQTFFVVAQLTLSLVLLAAAGLFIGAIRRAASTDIGMDPRNVVAVSFDVVLQNYAPDRRTAFREQLADRIGGLPGVENATVANLVPLSGVMYGTSLSAEGDAEAGSTTYMNGVAPGFFSTLRIPLLRGRDFTRTDGASAAPVVILNEIAARMLWPGQQALGRRVRVGGQGEPLREVVGIARVSKYDEPSEDARPFVYLPLAQQSLTSQTTLLARVSGDAPATIAAIREEIRRMDSTLPLFDLTTIENYVQERLDKQRGISRILTAFGALALVLAAIGLYGVMAYTVSLRSREIGIRVALGEEPARLLRSVVYDGLRLAALGLGFGALLAVPVGFLVQGGVFGVLAIDVPTFATSATLLLATAIVASLQPARRAARLDPLTALRAE
jgi:predicted permease